MKIPLLALFCISSIAFASPCPDQLLAEIIQDPLASFIARDQANNLNWPERAPHLRQIIADLNARLAPGSVLDRPQFNDDKARLRELLKRGQDLLEQQIPESKLNLFILDYSQTMQQLLRSVDPALTGHYHADFAERLLPKVLDTKGGTHIFFTEASVTDIDLWHIRPSALYLQYLIQLPPFKFNAANYPGGPLIETRKAQRYLDGIRLDIDEIVKHDIGHSWYMQRQDEWLFETAGYARRDLVREWTDNKNKIVKEWNALPDPDFKEAARFLIAEVIHERGYQFYLPILRQQFASPKWSQILKAKQGNRYWGKFGITDQALAQAEPARAWILNLVETMLREENIRRLTELKGPVRLKTWPDLESYQGVPLQVKANSPQDIRVTFDVPGVGRKETSLYEISLVLAPIAAKPLLTKDRIAIADQLSKIESYKLERLLNLIEQKQSTNFTLTSPPVSYSGIIHSSDQNELTLNDQRFALSQISLQPPDDHQINLDPNARFVSETELHQAYEVYRESYNSTGPNFVTLQKDGESFELGMIETQNLKMARAVSSLLTRSLEDAKDINGGYLPPSVVERVQRELVSPYGVRALWGRIGRRFILSRAIGNGQREIVGSALVGESRDHIFFLTSRFNNLRQKTLRDEVDPSVSADGDPNHKWFDKFDYPDFDRLKPPGYHHLANFVIEREGVRGRGLARFLLDSIVKNYSREYLNRTGSPIMHSQRLLCGKGFWQIGDPPWLERMRHLGFSRRLGAESFHLDVDWAPLVPTFDRNGQVRQHVDYNHSFGLPGLYATPEDTSDSQSADHLVERIPHVVRLSQSGRAKLQYFQLIYPFARTAN